MNSVKSYNYQLQNKAYKLQNKQKYVKNQKICKALVDIEYFDINSWLKKSFSEYNFLKNVESGQTLIDCINNLNSQDRRFIKQLGMIEFQQGNFGLSLEYLNRYMTLDPNCRNTKIQMAQTYFRMGEVQEAEIQAKSLLAQPNISQYQQIILYNLMVQIQHTQSNYESMREYADLILQLKPNDSFSLIYLADLDMNNYQKRDDDGENRNRNEDNQNMQSDDDGNKKREDAIKLLKRLRLQIYQERHLFSIHTFQDLINIIFKYDDILRE